MDHFSTSNPKNILKTAILETEMVDRYLVYGIMKVNDWRYKRENKKSTTIELRNMKECHSALSQEDLQQIDWKTVLDPLSDDPSSMADTFQEIFESTLGFMLRLKRTKYERNSLLG